MAVRQTMVIPHLETQDNEDRWKDSYFIQFLGNSIAPVYVIENSNCEEFVKSSEYKYGCKLPDESNLKLFKVKLEEASTDEMFEFFNMLNSNGYLKDQPIMEIFSRFIVDKKIDNIVND